jgi:hypothetical protein
LIGKENRIFLILHTHTHSRIFQMNIFKRKKNILNTIKNELIYLDCNSFSYILQMDIGLDCNNNTLNFYDVIKKCIFMVMLSMEDPGYVNIIHLYYKHKIDKKEHVFGEKIYSDFEIIESTNWSNGSNRGEMCTMKAKMESLFFHTETMFIQEDSVSLYNTLFMNELHNHIDNDKEFILFAGNIYMNSVKLTTNISLLFAELADIFTTCKVFSDFIDTINMNNIFTEDGVVGLFDTKNNNNDIRNKLNFNNFHKYMQNEMETKYGYNTINLIKLKFVGEDAINIKSGGVSFDKIDGTKSFTQNKNNYVFDYNKAKKTCDTQTLIPELISRLKGFFVRYKNLMDQIECSYQAINMIVPNHVNNSLEAMFLINYECIKCFDYISRCIITITTA